MYKFEYQTGSRCAFLLAFLNKASRLLAFPQPFRIPDNYYISTPITTASLFDMSGNNETQNPSTIQQPPTSTVSLTFEMTPPYLNVGPITQPVLFTIRNGPVVEKTMPLLVRPTMAAMWHWRTIANMDPMRSLEFVGEYIQLYYAQIITHPTAGNTQELNRKIAIVLGVARAVSTALYKITEADLIVEETADPWLECVLAEDGTTAIAVLPNVSANIHTALCATLERTDVEKAAITAIHISAIGLLPLQGYSLAMCGHHYLSDPASQSRKAYAVVEKAHWMSTSVSTWFSQDAEKIRDALWHKSGHPVNLTIKRELAFNPDVPKMLIVAGAASAASRLPAVEPELRAAKNYRTLCQTVGSLIEGCGGTMNYQVLDAAIATLQAYPEQDPTAVLSDLNAPGVPATVNNRATAMEWLQQVMDKNRHIVAACYGFYTALSQQNAMLSGVSSSVDILMTSYSLTKLRTQNLSSFMAGQQAYVDYTARKAAERAAGKLKALEIRFM